MRRSRWGRARILTSVLSGSMTMVALVGCSESTGPDPEGASFGLVATYDSIRSYPGGGGVFLVQLTQKEGFTGQVLLTVEAADRLRAEMDVATLGGDRLTAELSLRPEHAISPGHFRVRIVGTQGKQEVKLPLDVEIVDWEVEGISEFAATEKARFTTWLADQDPAFAGLGSQAWVAFQTYPEMLVVEHWTFLSPEWEMRICVHVMIPPYDWSMVRLRRRGETEPAVTARRETDGTIHPIAPGEYPLFGY